MGTSNRRDFLKIAGAGMAGVSMLKLAPSAEAAKAGDAIPPHKPLEVAGVHAYPGEHSIVAGTELVLHVSSTVPHSIAICRLGPRVDDPESDQVLHVFPQLPAKPQPIHPGSYVQVDKRLSAEVKALTLECWVRLWKVSDEAGLVTQYDAPGACGLGLFLKPAGAVGFYLGDGGAHRPEWLHVTGKGLVKVGKWHHVVATCDGREKTIWIDGQNAGRWEHAAGMTPGKAPLRLGASGESGLAGRFLDGDLAMTAVYQRALTPAEIAERFNEQGLSVPKGKSVLAAWDFDEERGERVADSSGGQRHGRIVNRGTWMIGGPSFQADVPRFGNYDPRRDARRGHGLRLASDDLYDCRWAATQRYLVPRDARPGIYVARFRYEQEGKPRLYHMTFIVRRAARRKAAPILVVAATNTWRAYSGTGFAMMPTELKQVWGTRGLKNPANNPPAFDLYATHAAGQGTYQMGLRMPWPAAGPYVLYGGPTDYSHLMRAERFLHVWLEQAGYEFDVISDLDLHRDPGVLRGYRTFIINGHNEYWSIRMYRAVESYLKGGGNVIGLSGNTMFWRVSFDADCAVMECRKVDAPGNQVVATRRGEAWHSHDGLRGGMMRECGFPGWQLLGLDSLGWNNQSNKENFGPYVAEHHDHFLFNYPVKLNFQKGEKFGWVGEGKMPMANGHEFDVRPSTLAALQQQPSPPGASVPRDPPGMVRIANGIIPWKKGGSAFDYFFRLVKPTVDQGGEMIYWERPDGGKVFNAGSIGAGWALLADAKMQGLMRNVLAHFGVERG
jgi:N,N-dimethylformamidase